MKLKIAKAWFTLLWYPWRFLTKIVSFPWFATRYARFFLIGFDFAHKNTLHLRLKSKWFPDLKCKHFPWLLTVFQLFLWFYFFEFPNFPWFSTSKWSTEIMFLYSCILPAFPWLSLALPAFPESVNHARVL